MKNENEEVTQYIENAADFAKPILQHLRELIHETCPDIVEYIKWGKPNFYYKGTGMCLLDALKERVTFGCWYDSLIYDSGKLSKEAIAAKERMGFMKDITKIPSDEIFVETIKAAMEVKEKGIKLAPKSKRNAELLLPEFIKKAISEDKTIAENFEKLSPSHRKEYIVWIVDAKTEETRARRLQQMLDQVVEGKEKNWKYKK